MFSKRFETRRETRTDYVVGCGASLTNDTAGRLSDVPAVIVVDEKVAALHGHVIGGLTERIDDLGVLRVGGGETIKGLAEVAKVIRFAENAGLPKHGSLIAIGGGTVCDVVATSAMLFRRGIGLTLMPTTLLGQIDAAVGGKNGVNHGATKNLVGHFYHPSLVCCDQNFLTTLGEREMICGLAEAIKVLAVSDGEALRRHFFDGSLQVRADQPDAWCALVEDALSWKLDLLDEDPFEESSRRLLNYGHACAHFFEEHSNYALAHGEAVLLGMIIENEISRLLGIASADDLERLQDLILGFLTPACARYWMRFPEVRHDFERLRQQRRGMMNYVCVETLGFARIVDDVDDALLAEAWTRSEDLVLEHSAHATIGARARNTPHLPIVLDSAEFYDPAGA